MTRYGYLNLSYEEGRYYVSLQCTEPEMGQWFVDEMTKAFPDSEVKQQQCQQGILYRAVVIPAYYDHQLKASITRELCHAGWEPLYGAVGLGEDMSFRKILD